MVSIPYELLKPIFDQLPLRAKAKLRLTCWDFKHALDADVFSTLTLTVSNHELLKTLATLDTITRISDYVETVNIRHVGTSAKPTSEPRWNAQPKKPTTRYLSQAIKSLQSVKVANWKIDGSGNIITQDIIFQALVSLEQLEEFSVFIIAPLFGLPLQQLSSTLSHISISAPQYVFERLSADLSEFVARNSGLRSLRLENITHFVPKREQVSPMMNLSTFMDNIGPIEILHLRGWDISNVNSTQIQRHFHSLSTLHLCGVDPTLWSTLQAAEIHICDLRNEDIDMLLMQYLASYSGLVKLSLADLYNDPEIAILADLFYKKVVLKHCNTLEDLDLRISSHREWCFSDACSPSILQCTKLQKLSIALDDSASTMEQTTNLLLKSLLSSYPSLFELNIRAYRLPGNGTKEFSWRYPNQSLDTTRSQVENAIISFKLLGRHSCNPLLRIYLPRLHSQYYYPEYIYEEDSSVKVKLRRYEPSPPDIGPLKKWRSLVAKPSRFLKRTLQNS